MSSIRIVNVQTVIALGGLVVLGASVFAFAIDSSLFGLKQDQHSDAVFAGPAVTDTNTSTVPVIAYEGNLQEGLDGWYADESLVGDEPTDASDWTDAEEIGADETGFGSDAQPQSSSGESSTVTNAARIE